MSPDSRIEIEIEGVDRPVPVVVHDDGTAHGTLGLAGSVRGDSFEPVGLRVGIDALFRRQKHAGVPESVEAVEIVERQRRGRSDNLRPVDHGCGMHELLPDVCGPVGVLAVKPDQWGCESQKHIRRQVPPRPLEQ